MGRFRFRSQAPHSVSRSPVSQADSEGAHNDGPFSEAWALAVWGDRLSIKEAARPPRTLGVLCASCCRRLTRREERLLCEENGEVPASLASVLARCPVCGRPALIAPRWGEWPASGRAALLRFLFQRFRP